MPQAGIPMLHRDLAVMARRPQAMTVLEEFAAGAMGAECSLLSADQIQSRVPMAAPGALGGLWSPHERRVEPRTAIPALAAWLERSHKVTFLRDTAAHGVESGAVDTAMGRIGARHIVVCPGPDLVSLFPERLAARRLSLCKLQMLRLAAPGWRLPASVMGDLSLIRYEGYAVLPGAAALKIQLAAELGDALDHGIHLIVVQSADGSLVIGDSHHYATTPDPFVPAEVEAIILREARTLLALPDDLPVIERWTGHYPSSAEETAFLDRVAPDILLSLVSSGTGMITAFALGEEGIAALLGEPDPLEAI
jgi:FAD dependent oxidoreductase TIGR03364